MVNLVILQAVAILFVVVFLMFASGRCAADGQAQPHLHPHRRQWHDRPGGRLARVEGRSADGRDRHGGGNQCRDWPCAARHRKRWAPRDRSEEHTSELQSLMRISYAVFCLKKKKYVLKKYYNHK